MLPYLILLLIIFIKEDQKHNNKIGPTLGGWQQCSTPAAVSLWQVSRSPHLYSELRNKHFSLHFLSWNTSNIRLSTYKKHSLLLCSYNHLITLACRRLNADSATRSPLDPRIMAYVPILCHILLVSYFESSF